MRHEGVDPNIWTDQDFDNCRNPDVFLLYIYYIANPQSHGLTGIYRCPGDRVVRAATRLTPKRFERAKETLVALEKIVFHDGWLWVVGKSNHAVFGPNQATGAASYIKHVPQELARAYIAKYGDLLTKFGAEPLPTVPNGSKPPDTPRTHDNDTVSVSGNDSDAGSESDTAPPADAGALQQLTSYWTMTKGGDVSPIWRKKIAEALRQGVTVAEVKLVLDRVRVDINPWKLLTELLDQHDGGKGNGAKASGRNSKRSSRRYKLADEQKGKFDNWP